MKSPEAESLFRASSSRPLPLRRRPDLAISWQEYEGRRSATIKDPLALSYFRLDEEEFALFEMLDGQASLDDLREAFMERFAPARISLGELQRFIGSLHRRGLLIGEAAGQGERLAERAAATAGRARLAMFSNILCLRLRGIDPDRALAWLNKRFGWLFSTPAVAAAMFFAALALLLALVEFDAVAQKLPSSEQLFAAQNWLWLAVTLAATKIAHELGHGVACKRFGGECREMGLMLLVFTPCLYCNVSDSWMLPSKWRRAAVAAAGMYVELLLASAAAFLWWASRDGLFNHLCLNVMFVCSVSTLFFNANPLMRYDGYYILSDLTNVPNLRAKADAALGAWFRRALGSDAKSERRSWPLVAYALASAIYRLFVTVGVLWFLYHALEPYGLKIVGQLAATGVLLMTVIPKTAALARRASAPTVRPQRSRRRLALFSAAALAATIAILYIPLPHHVVCPVKLAARDARAVYVETPGRLSAGGVRAGELVAADENIATLVDRALEIEVAALEAERELLSSRSEALTRQSHSADVSARKEAAHRLAATRVALDSIDEQLARRVAERDRLVIRAPRAGEVLWPPAKRRPADAGAKRGLRLASWSGAPLDSSNRGAWLDEGVLLCQIGDGRKLAAILAIGEADVEFVAAGQAVDIVFEALPYETYATSIDRLSHVQIAGAASSPDWSGATFQASAPIDDARRSLYLGATGRAKIQVGSRTIGERLWRSLCSVFEFQL